MTADETKAAAIKDEGNKSFKSGQFPAAIAVYTKVATCALRIVCSELLV